MAGTEVPAKFEQGGFTSGRREPLRSLAFVANRHYAQKSLQLLLIQQTVFHSPSQGLAQNR